MIDWIYEINPAGWMHLVFFGVAIPLAALRSRRFVLSPRSPALDRMKHFRSTVLSLGMLGAVSILTAVAQGINLTRFDLMGSLKAAPVAIAMYILAVALMRPRWRHTVENKGRLAYLFMPQSSSERAWWIAISLLAGITEEITWRGVQPVVINALVGNVFVAALLSAIMFGVAHAVQGWRSAAITVLFALAFQTLVWICGSLLIAMVAHAAYDITAGLTYGRLGTELGYKLEECAQV